MVGLLTHLQNCEKRLLASSCLSVRPPVRLSAWKNLGPTGRIFMIFRISVFFENMSRKFKFNQNRTTITGTLHEDQYTPMFSIISRSFLPIVKNVSDKSRETRNTHFMFNKFCFRKSCSLWDNVEKYCRSRPAADDNMAHGLCMLDT